MERELAARIPVRDLVGRKSRGTLLPMRWISSAGLGLLAASAHAWHDTGHMLVSEIAGRGLTPKVSSEVKRLLAIGGTPETNNLLTAACWADDFKTNENGPWHYINYHFRADGQPSMNTPLAENVVWAVRKFTEALRNPRTTDALKADALRFLLHFVGDIHQPLHNVARNTAATPEGDRGGNDFKFEAPPGLQPSPRNLHFLWDMGAGAFPHVERPLSTESQSHIRTLADEIVAMHPADGFAAQLSKADAEEWSRESLDFAKAHVYALEEGKTPPPAYLDMVQKESRRLVALAGYRLSALLNRAFGN